MSDLLITGDLHPLAPPGSPLPAKVEALGVRDGVIVN